MLINIRPKQQPKISMMPDGEGGLMLVLSAPDDPSDATQIRFDPRSALQLLMDMTKILRETNTDRLTQAMRAGLQPGMNMVPNGSGGATLTYVAPGHPLDGVQLVLDRGAARTFVQAGCDYLHVTAPELPRDAS